jgi:periplasmic protein CpxP/Spy
MKSSLKFLPVSVMLAALMVVPLLRADNAAPAANPAPASPPAPITGKKAGHAHKNYHLQVLSEKLSLTDDQKAKVTPILEDQTKQLKALHADASLSDDERKAKRHDIMQSAQDQIRPLLTADQQSKFDAMRKHHRKDKSGKA